MKQEMTISAQTYAIEFGSILLDVIDMMHIQSFAFITDRTAMFVTLANIPLKLLIKFRRIPWQDTSTTTTQRYFYLLHLGSHPLSPACSHTTGCCYINIIFCVRVMVWASLHVGSDFLPCRIFFEDTNAGTQMIVIIFYAPGMVG